MESLTETLRSSATLCIGTSSSDNGEDEVELEGPGLALGRDAEPGGGIAWRTRAENLDIREDMRKQLGTEEQHILFTIDVDEHI